MIQYRKQYDVVVAGAGVAGVAAALAAARHGKKVALLEKQCVIGGLATSGWSSSTCPCATAWDANAPSASPKSC